MSNTTLHNENVAVTLKALGGEWASIKDASGTEYLWQGNPEFWSGQAPVLFPIVGCLMGNEYKIPRRCRYHHDSGSQMPSIRSIQRSNMFSKHQRSWNRMQDDL